MNPNIRQIASRSAKLLNQYLPLVMIAGGWAAVMYHNRNVQASFIESYQVQQSQAVGHLADVLESQIRQSGLKASHQVEPMIRRSVQDLNRSVLKQQPMLADSSRRFVGEPFWFYPLGVEAARMALPDPLKALGSGALPKRNDGKMIHTYALVEVNDVKDSPQTWVIGQSVPIEQLSEHGRGSHGLLLEMGLMGLFSGAMLCLQYYLRQQCRTNQRYEMEVMRLAETDALTGLANRNKLQREGEHLLKQLTPPESLALVTLNLDRFKPINDQLGTEAGDELLVKVAKRLQRQIRQADILARVGSDEFAILLRHGDVNQAQHFADRLLKSFDRPFSILNRPIYVSVSIGIATIGDSGCRFSQLMTQADIALYRAKTQYHCGYALFNAAMNEQQPDQLSLEADLRRSIEHNELQVYYQPIVELVTGQVKGYEALIRWQHRQRGLLTPGDFLPIAVMIGQMIEIERWVLRQACMQMAQWHGRTARSPWQYPSISINISAPHIAQDSLVDYITTVLQETNWPAHRLNLEITEEAMIQQPERVARILTQIRRLGVRISLDDFGTGYSSLSYLQRFPVDTLKIDKCFIDTVHDSSQDSEIVKSIIALANSLGVETIAEGIETPEQLQQLRQMNCQYGQGFLFAQPLAYDRLGEVDLSDAPVAGQLVTRHPDPVVALSHDRANFVLKA